MQLVLQVEKLILRMHFVDLKINMSVANTKLEQESFLLYVKPTINKEGYVKLQSSDQVLFFQKVQESDTKKRIGDFLNNVNAKVYDEDGDLLSDTHLKRLTNNWIFESKGIKYPIRVMSHSIDETRIIDLVRSILSNRDETVKKRYGSLVEKRVILIR